MNILIVDNCAETILQMSELLRQSGYQQLFTTINTEEAIQIIFSKDIDLLLIDVMLPNMVGIQACSKIRTMSKDKELIIIATVHSEFSSEEIIQEALDAGANDFLRKPLTKIELIARISLAEKGYQEKIKRKTFELQFEEDLLLAKNFQRGVLTPDVVNKEVNMRSYYDPCANVGGDMYCWHKINDHQYGVMIYDVMGHGIASSLVNMSIYSLTKSIITRLQKPDLVMKELNRQVYFLLQQGNSMDIYFVTGTYLLIDRKKNTISYANAGHPIGYLFYSTDDVHLLKPTAPFIGVVRVLPVEVKEVELKVNSRIILYTDGLKDYLNVSYDELEQLFREALDNREDSFIKTFTQSNDLSAKIKKDDICLLSLLIK